MLKQSQIHSQINLIEKQMKAAGVWSFQVPDWVHSYSEEQIPDIWQWLQYIHLPMRMHNRSTQVRYLAPRITSYINNEDSQQKILKLIIELDSLSPTNEKSNESTQ